MEGSAETFCSNDSAMLSSENARGWSLIAKTSAVRQPYCDVLSLPLSPSSFCFTTSVPCLGLLGLGNPFCLQSVGDAW